MSAPVAPEGIYVVEHGPAEAEPPLVVMVHGTMDRSASFARAARRLRDLRVITYDRRGYGRSSAMLTGTGSLSTHVEDLVDILDGRRAAIVGHSFGGDVALALALARPDLVAAVGAYEPPMPWIEWWPAGGASLDIRHRGLEDPEQVAEHFIRNVAGDEVWESLPEATKSRRRAEGRAVLADITALTGGATPFTVAELRASVNGGVPVRLGSGSRSKSHQRDGTARLGAEIGVPVTVLDDARHGGHSSHPDAFAQWVREIVAAARRGGAS